MKKIEMTEFLNGVATFNADPYCVEDEVMASELFDETQGELEEITNVDDFEDAVLKLDLEGRSPKRIYRCGTALVCLSNDFDYTTRGRRGIVIITKNIMYEIIDVIHDYLFVTLRLRDVRTGAIRDWQHWDDLEDWLCEEYGVKDLKGLVIDALPKHGGWVATEFNCH